MRSLPYVRPTCAYAVFAFPYVTPHPSVVQRKYGFHENPKTMTRTPGLIRILSPSPPPPSCRDAVGSMRFLR